MCRLTCGERASTSFRTPSGPDSAGRRTNGDGAAPAGIRLSSRLVPPQDDLTFAVPLDDRLPPGQYTVMAEILVNGNAMNPQIERIPVVIGEAR